MTGILVDIGFLDFLSRIPTIPELKRYKSEIVIKEVEEDEGGSSSDSSSDGEADWLYEWWRHQTMTHNTMT